MRYSPSHKIRSSAEHTYFLLAYSSQSHPSSIFLRTPLLKPIHQRNLNQLMAATNSFLIPTLSLRQSTFFNFIPSFSRFDPHNNSKHALISSSLFISGSSLSKKSYVLQASPDGANAIGSLMSDLDSDHIPMPVVLIDQDSDPVATVVQLSFGDRLGALIDTMKALKDLGLDVSKGIVTTEGAVKQTKLFITRSNSGRKVEDPDMLEGIRLTIIDNLLKYHPESSERLAMGEAFGVKAPVEKPDLDVATHIHIQDDGPKKSWLYIETADRSGLLMEVIKIMADINVDVESAEIDTEGLVAKDKFHVSYRGAALNSSLSQVLVNCLRYYLRRPQTDEDSY